MATLDPKDIDHVKVQKQMNELLERTEKALDSLTWKRVDAQDPETAPQGAEFFHGTNENLETKSSLTGVTVCSWTTMRGLQNPRSYEGASMSEDPPLMLHLTGEVAKKAYEAAVRAIQEEVKGTL